MKKERNSETPMMELRRLVEEKAGRRMQTPKDFDYLHEYIFEQCHEMVSASTLKRIWGYNRDGGTPRLSSLNPLARLIGYADYQSYLEAMGYDSVVADDTDSPADEETDAESEDRRWKWAWMTSILLVIAVVAAGFLWYHRTPAPPDSRLLSPDSRQRVLHKGEDCFPKIEDYLMLFGIENGDTAYFRPVPNLKYIYVWSPEYGNPVWHNEGDSSLLMPTITEWWTPRRGARTYHSPEFIKEVNAKLYYERTVKDELRITFMKNLTEDGYLFLGIYRMDRDSSTLEHFVWRRVADDCDLGALEQIELLRADN